jgi:photosystem II stability/assembly factor-like uncharacterized protein
LIRKLALLLLTSCSPHWAPVGPALDRAALSVAPVAEEQALVAGGALGSGGDALLAIVSGGSVQRIATNIGATFWWVHAFSATDAWVVGENGTAGHFDGTTLTLETTPTTLTLYGVWGASTDDLWAVGGEPGAGNVVLRRDASGWRQVTSPTAAGAYFKIWGSSANDVFICGEGATILHWDGSAFTVQPTGISPTNTLLTVAGRSSTEVYAVGGFGLGVVLAYDGTRWSQLTDPALDTVAGLAGVSIDSDGTLMLAGAGGTKLHGRPGALIDDTLEPPRDDLHGTAARFGRLWAVGGNYLAPMGVARTGVIARR